MGLKAKGKHKATKFFTYEVSSGRCKEIYGNKVGYEPLAFGMKDGFLTSRLGKVNHKFFDQVSFWFSVL